MGIGTLHASVVLDEPHRLHTDPQDIVTGHVVLFLTPDKPSITEYFGPLKVAVLLEGESETRYVPRSGRQYQRRWNLIPAYKCVYNKPIRLTVGRTCKVPFEVSFKCIRRPSVFGDSALPPSAVFSNRNSFGIGIEAYARYSISLKVEVPLIQALRISANGNRPVRYRPLLHLQGQSPGREESSGPVGIPMSREDDGLFSKMWSFLEASVVSTPTDAFHVSIDSPERIFLLRPITLDITVAPTNAHFASSLSGLCLRYSELSIFAITSVQAARCGGGVCEDTTIGRMEELLWSITVTGGCRPFGSEPDLTKTLRTKAIPIPQYTESFVVNNVARWYELEVKLWFGGASRERVTKRVRVEIHSAESFDCYDQDDDLYGAILPSYEEVMESGS